MLYFVLVTLAAFVTNIPMSIAMTFLQKLDADAISQNRNHNCQTFMSHFVVLTIVELTFL